MPNPSLHAAVDAILLTSVGGDSIRTLDRHHPNWIAMVTSSSVLVETDASRRRGSGPQPIDRDWITQAIGFLEQHGQITVSDLSEHAAHRSSFIFALLATAPGVGHTIKPRRLFLETINEG